MWLLSFASRPLTHVLPSGEDALPLPRDCLLLILQVQFRHFALQEALFDPQAGSRPLPWVAITLCTLLLLNAH